MIRTVSLINWTEQGIKTFRDSPTRADQVSALAEKMGGRMTAIYWCVGEYDIVAIAEFPDDETATAFLLQVGAQGNVRTQTMRAFDRSEIQSVIEKTG